LILYSTPQDTKFTKIHICQSCWVKIWLFKVRKVKIMVLGNPDPHPDKICPYLDPDPPSGWKFLKTVQIKFWKFSTFQIWVWRVLSGVLTVFDVTDSHNDSHSHAYRSDASVVISAGVFCCSWCQTSIHFRNASVMGGYIVVYKYLWTPSSRDWSLEAKIHPQCLADLILLNLIDRWSHQMLHCEFRCAKQIARHCNSGMQSWCCGHNTTLFFTMWQLSLAIQLWQVNTLTTIDHWHTCDSLNWVSNPWWPQAAT